LITTGFSQILTLYSIYFPSLNTGYVASTGKILKTTNSGSNWMSQNLNTGYTLRSVYFTDDNSGYVVGDTLFSNSSKVFKTTNGGTSWISQFFNGIGFNSVYFVNSNTGYMTGYWAGNGYIYKTTDAGNSWNQLLNELNAGFYSVDFPDINNGFATAGNGTLYKTTNAGDNWGTRSVSAFRLNSVYFPNKDTGFVAGDNGRIYRTTNNGLTWIRQLLETTNILQSIYFVNSTTGYCAGWNGIILKTTNSGVNWIQQAPVSNNNLYSVFFTNSNTGYATGDRGTIIKTIDGGSVISVNQISSSIPDKFYLYQNYPNPFNPGTVIRYSINENRFISLKVYNILGNEIATLVNEKQDAGIYEVQWNGSNYSSGVYYYRIEADGFTETKKMLLLK
jgi:photosystem II stability/assembly factor-like uncharacterized protein